MPQFIVRTAPVSKDGSTLGGAGMIVVTDTSIEAAKISGAASLGVPVNQVIAEPFKQGDAMWRNL
jgi:hypothetical protein